MAHPLFAEARGGVQSPDFRDEDIVRFFDSLALALAERLKAAPDSEASLTLLSVMKSHTDHLWSVTTERRRFEPYEKRSTSRNRI